MNSQRPLFWLLFFLLGFHLLLDNFLLIEDLNRINIYKIAFLSALGLLAVVQAKEYRNNSYTLFALIIYLTLSFQFFALIPSSYNKSSSLEGTISFFIKVPLLFLILALLFSARGSAIAVLPPVWTTLAIIFSIQSILLFLFIYIFHVDIQRTLQDFGRIRTEPIISYGLWGYHQSPPRVQSFFSEPNKLAQFLIFPIFWAIGSDSRAQRWFIFPILFICLILTTSFSTFAGLALAGLLYFGLKMKSSILRWGFLFGGLVVLIALPIFGKDIFYRPLQFKDENLQRIFFRPHSISNKEQSLRSSIEIANEHPWGIGAIRREDAKEFDYLKLNAGSGVVDTLLTSGWIGIGLNFLLLLVLTVALLKVAGEVRNGTLHRQVLATGVAVFAMGTANITHGPFHQRLFIIMVVFFLSAACHPLFSKK